MTEKEKIIIEINKGKLFIQNATCPNGHSLMSEEVKIHNMSSIKVKFKFDDVEGIICLDPSYGTFEHIYNTKISNGKIVDFLCPECNISLKIEGSSCPACGAPHFRFLLPRGGYIEGCLRKGCIQHELRFTDIDDQLATLYKERMMF